MYGKLFHSMYDGTLADDWRALVTFQQLIILCDADGVVDMTPRAIASRTGIPIEHIEAGLRILEEPDPYSRTPDQAGRRIELIDEHRPWGWVIVTHNKYRDTVSASTIREQTRLRVQKHRDKKRLINQEGCNGKVLPVTHGNSKKRHTDTDTDTDTDTTGKNASVFTGNGKVPIKQIIDKWNVFATETNLPKVVKTTTALSGQIRQRWNDIPTLEQWDNFFASIGCNDFLSGKVPPGYGRSTPFRSTLLWVTKETNFAKIAAGEYN